jgi:hypothetical protein
MNASYRQATRPKIESNTVRASVHSSDFALGVFILIHPFLALAMSASSLLATAHAILTICVGLIFAVFSKDERKAIYVTAYMVGAEVLWRMTNAGVFWEVGKYAVSAVLLIALIRNRRLNIAAFSTLYFLLLLPSTIYTINSSSLSDARSLISFNLSGPLSLMVCAWFFKAVPITRLQLQRMVMILIAPVTGIAAIAIYSTFTHRTILFTDTSNFISSGGFGPNQVSSVLGLAALLIFLYMFAKQDGRAIKMVLFLLLLVFAFQSALTFSRSGLYLAGAGMLTASLFLSRDIGVLVRNILLFLVLYLISQYLFLPWVDHFTQGQFIQRFQSLSLTGRDLIARSDWVIWMNNFWLGVGPGMSDALHSLYFRASASHVEFTRLLAEHGFLGLLSLLLLAIMGMKSLLQAKGAVNRAFVAAMLVWFVAYLASNAMRLVAPSFLFGLAMNQVFVMEDLPQLHQREQ